MPEPKWDVQFTGLAEIAGQRLHVEACLENGECVLIALDKIPTIQVSQIFDHFFAPSLHWPVDILDLLLSDSVLIYLFRQNSGAFSLPAALRNVKGPGLFAASKVLLTLANVSLPELEVCLCLIKNQGLQIDATLIDPVTLLADFLVLSGSGFKGGPELSLQTYDQPGGAKRRFALACAFTLLGTQIAETDLTLTSDGQSKSPALAAVLSHPGSLGPFQDPKLSLSWSKSAGFKVEDFPHIPIPNINLDFANLLRRISSKNGCGEIVDLVFKDTIKQHFVAKPSISTTKPARPDVRDGQLFVIIHGYYRLSLEDTVVANVDLPELVISLSMPSEFTFDSIVDRIARSIEENAEAVVEQLWDDKAQLFTVLAVFLGEEGLKKVVSAATCKALQALGGAALEALAYALLVLGEYVSGPLLLLLAALFVIELLHWSTSGQEAHPLPQPELDPPSWDGTVVICWREVTGAVGYQVLSPQEGDTAKMFSPPIQRLNPGVCLARITLQDSLPAGTYDIQVKALAAASDVFTDSAYRARSITKLAKPASVTLYCDATGDTAITNWDVDPSASEYTIEIFAAATGLIAASAKVVNPPGGGCQTLSQDFATGRFAPRVVGEYQVRIQATASEKPFIPGDVVESPATLLLLPPPVLVILQIVSDRLIVHWSPVASVAGYRLVVTNLDSGEEAQRTVCQDPAEDPHGMLMTDLLFSKFEHRAAGRHRVCVAALGDESHISSAATAADTDVVLFRGVGFDQIGTTFQVA